MIRVLHVLHSLNRGGAETFVMNVYRNIDRNKVQFDFLISYDKKCDFEDEINDLGGKIYRCIPRNKGLLKNKKSLMSFFEQYRKNYNTIHVHLSSLSNINVLKIAKRFKVNKRIIHSHSTQEGGKATAKFIHNILHAIHQKSIKKYATDYFSCSKKAAKWMYGENQYNKGDYIVINNAIDIEKFNFSINKRNKIRKELNLENKFVIGHVGRFALEKNHDFLIDIFNEVYKKNQNARLLLIGDGPLKPNIERKIKDLKLDNVVIFLGVRSDVSELLSVMDVFLFPSKYEGLGIVLVEAQTNGLYCLTSSVVPKEVNFSNRIEYVSLEDSAETWANILLSENLDRKDISVEIKNAGFDIKEVAKNLMKVYLK